MEELRLKGRIAALYEGKSETAERFRYGLLIADITTILFLVVVTYFHGAPWIRWADLAFGLYLGLDYLARFWVPSSSTRSTWPTFWPWRLWSSRWRAEP
jgi:hypothetical protein